MGKVPIITQKNPHFSDNVIFLKSGRWGLFYRGFLKLKLKWLLYKQKNPHMKMGINAGFIPVCSLANFLVSAGV